MAVVQAAAHGMGAGGLGLVTGFLLLAGGRGVVWGYVVAMGPAVVVVLETTYGATDN